MGEAFEHSTLGLALATHVIEYMAPAIASDFPAYGRDVLLPGFGVTNAGWKLSHWSLNRNLICCKTARLLVAQMARR